MKDKVHISITRDGYWSISNPDGSPTSISGRDLFKTLAQGIAAIRSANCVPVRDTGRDNRRWV